MLNTFFSVLLAPLLGASPTTSASILVEFGGNDWAAGCVVVHAFSHMYMFKKKKMLNTYACIQIGPPEGAEF